MDKIETPEEFAQQFEKAMDLLKIIVSSETRKINQARFDGKSHNYKFIKEAPND